MYNKKQVTVDQYKNTEIMKGFQVSELSKAETQLHENLEKGLIDQELFLKAKQELDILKGGNKHNFSTKEREKLSEEKEAMPDGSFPIRNEQDLKDAIKSFGRAKDKEAVKAWIKKRAKALGKEESLPEDWVEKSVEVGDIEKGGKGSGRHIDPYKGKNNERKGLLDHLKILEEERRNMRYKFPNDHTNELDEKIESVKKEINKSVEVGASDVGMEKADYEEEMTKANLSEEEQNKVHKVMKEFKEGKLKTSAGEEVTDRKQAVAIALSEAKNINKGKESNEELITEHERLVKVLDSPSHKDDKKEAKKQEKELEEYKQKRDKLVKGIEDTLKSNLEKGLIDQELFDKANKELDTLRGK